MTIEIRTEMTTEIRTEMTIEIRTEITINVFELGPEITKRNDHNGFVLLLYFEFHPPPRRMKFLANSTTTPNTQCFQWPCAGLRLRPGFLVLTDRVPEASLHYF